MIRIFALVILAAPAWADAPQAVDVQAQESGGGWRFDVTILHPDSGWDHYADGWRIEDADGQVLGLRVLAHPHEAEQPFTRSLSGVAIPAGVSEVYVRTRCIVDGWSADTTALPLD